MAMLSTDSMHIVRSRCPLSQRLRSLTPMPPMRPWLPTLTSLHPAAQCPRCLCHDDSTRTLRMEALSAPVKRQVVRCHTGTDVSDDDEEDCTVMSPACANRSSWHILSLILPRSSLLSSSSPSSSLPLPPSVAHSLTYLQDSVLRRRPLFVTILLCPWPTSPNAYSLIRSRSPRSLLTPYLLIAVSPTSISQRPPPM
jgi:hypothetical protein